MAAGPIVRAWSFHASTVHVTSRSQHRVAMTMTALCLSYVRAVDATLAASSRRLSDRTSWADRHGLGRVCVAKVGVGVRKKAVFRSFHAMLRPLRGHLCIMHHLNPRQTLQHQPDCAPHATWRVPHGGGQGASEAWPLPFRLAQPAAPFEPLALLISPRISYPVA